MVISIRNRFHPDGRSVLLFAVTCLIAMFVLPMVSGAEASDEILSIETIGTGPINPEDPFSAEQAAINNALQLAIDEGVASVLSSEILADNFEEIITTFNGSAETFILNYKRLAVAKGDDYCRVLVRSSILAGDIKKRIKQAGIMINRESPPRLLILLSEYRPGQRPEYWWRKHATNTMTVAEKAMTKDFVKRGIAAVPHDRPIPGIDLDDNTAELNDGKALELGRHLGADFVISGKSSLILPGDFMPEKAGDVLGSLEARLLDVSTGSRIFMVSLQRQADASQNPPDALSALAAAGRASARQFSPAIISVFEQQKNRSRVYQIRIQGAGYLAQLNAFRNFLDTIDSVNRPQISEMKIDEAVISLDFSGSPRELARTLAETPSDRLAIRVINVLEDGVIIELKTAGVAADLNDAGKTFRP